MYLCSLIFRNGNCSKHYMNKKTVVALLPLRLLALKAGIMLDCLMHFVHLSMASKL